MSESKVKAARRAAQGGDNRRMTETPAPSPQVPPAYSQNGHGPSARLAELMEQLPRMLFGAVAAALQQAPLKPAVLQCADCTAARWGWMAAHKQETDTAYAAYTKAMEEFAGMEESDPRRAAPPDISMFLSPDLLPGGKQQMPPVADAETMAGGTLKCSGHAPGAPSQQSGGRLLVVQAGFTPSMLADLTR